MGFYPYSIATFSGVVSNIDSTTNRNGFANPLFRLSIVLVGGKPYSISEFANRVPKKINLGISFRVRPPTGQYLPEKLLNLGANRWAFKTALAGSYTISNKFIIEGYLISWIFTSNNNSFNGKTLSQKPVLAAQVHFSYIFNPKIWASGSIGRSFLGTTNLNGIERDDNQNNARFGLVFSYRMTKHHALKVAYTSGVSTRYGADFNTLLLAYQLFWFNKG